MAGTIVSIASGMVDPVYGNYQVPIKSYIMQQAEAFEQTSALKLLCREEKSDHWAEAYGDEPGLGEFEPTGEGGNYPATSFAAGFMQNLVNETWKSKFVVTQEMVEDTKIGKMKQRAKKLVTSYYRTRELFMRCLYLGGISGNKVAFSGKNFPCSSADGMSLFNTMHPSALEGNKKKQSNKYSDEFSVAILDKMETEMQNRTGDAGELLAVTPDTIWIPNDAALKRKVFEAVGADKDPDTNNNGFNYQFGRWNVVVDPYLTIMLARLGISKTPWFLLDSQFIQENDGAILQNRVPLVVKSTIDENTDDNIWKGRARFTGGFVDWRFCSVGNADGGTSLV